MNTSRLADLTPLFLMAQEPNQNSLAIFIVNYAKLKSKQRLAEQISGFSYR